ncbi:CDP-glycerol glycerophosphotransferase family protein [Methanobrevibacter sp.]|uniref:CDP-glycerol glycerophosphotransferase family protein n=1 Tax=Methanobrevibacter sp. TaxID=66852 RepID=UPI00388E1AAF
MNLKSKLKNFDECRMNSSIYNTYYNSKIDEEIVYLESRNGSDFTGNIFRIAEEISTGKYGNFKIYVFANQDVTHKIKRLEKNYGLNIHKVITDETEAVKILHKARYIFTDSGIRAKYVKRPGQIFVNTWHGTPLKLMGMDNPSEPPAIGIIQKAFLFSDYLIYPNDYMENIMLRSYMMDKIYPGVILHEGYPRNSVFLDNAKRDEFKERLNLKDIEIFVYMPTFKGPVNDRLDEKQNLDVNEFLKEIDMNLKDNQILFVKFHPYNSSKIDFSLFSHVQPFPEGYENYDILNMADVLITDYSSVFFDFANTRQKIIIFNYDEEEYLSYRGVYIPLEELPFPKVQNASDLLMQLNSEKDYEDEDFVDKFCRYDSVDSAERICRIVINDEKASGCRTIENHRKNILIYVAGMGNNDSFNQLIQFIGQEDLSDYNIFLAFKAWDRNIKENYLEIFKQIPEEVQFLPLSYNIFPTISEKLDLNRFLEKNGEVPKSLKNLFERSFKRQYGDFKFDKVIDFDASSILESLTFAFSGMDNAIVYNEDTDKNIINLFDSAYELNGELKINEIIK